MTILYVTVGCRTALEWFIVLCPWIRALSHAIDRTPNGRIYMPFLHLPRPKRRFWRIDSVPYFLAGQSKSCTVQLNRTVTTPLLIT